jgi:hypothetical protein
MGIHIKQFAFTMRDNSHQSSSLPNDAAETSERKRKNFAPKNKWLRPPEDEKHFDEMASLS